ncbi:Uncharacterised protein [Candidatus Tiddalikarchaeum anstoanum]|nr:Uncharacterised protein [Candidatus Tiddalikarchaeum anstoanum]
MIVAKLHKRGNDLLLAACDEELLGKTLNHSNGAEIFINPSFYKGDKMDKEEFIKNLKDATIINLFGKETVKIAVDANELSEDGAIIIAGVPHAQIVRML